MYLLRNFTINLFPHLTKYVTLSKGKNVWGLKSYSNGRGLLSWNEISVTLGPRVLGPLRESTLFAITQINPNKPCTKCLVEWDVSCDLVSPHLIHVRTLMFLVDTFWFAWSRNSVIESKWWATLSRKTINLFPWPLCNLLGFILSYCMRFKRV